MENKYVKGNPFFSMSKENEKKFEYLSKDLETEVVIIGGGLTGTILRILSY